MAQRIIFPRNHANPVLVGRMIMGSLLAAIYLQHHCPTLYYWLIVSGGISPAPLPYPRLWAQCQRRYISSTTALLSIMGSLSAAIYLQRHCPTLDYGVIVSGDVSPAPPPYPRLFLYCIMCNHSYTYAWCIVSLYNFFDMPETY